MRLSERRVKLAWAMPSVSNLDEVKTGISIPRYFQVLGHVAVPRLSDAILLLLLFYFHGLKVRGYSPSASRLVRRLVFVCHI